MASSHAAYCFLLLYCFTLQVVESTDDLPRSRQREVGFLCSRSCKELHHQHNDTDFPLYQCSCSPSCSVYSDCCFDSPYRDAKSTSKKFVCLSVVGHDRYAAVWSCPSDNPSDFCKEGLGHLQPVTSRVTNVTYANVFCARCNGENEDLFTWNVELRCSFDVNAVGETKYIYRSGHIRSLNEVTGSEAICRYHIHYNDFSFIDKSELRSCTGYVRKKSQCSSSWRDASVEEMCRSYEDPVYFHNTAFRNVHCATCNYENLEYADCIPTDVKVVLETGEVDPIMKIFCKTRGSEACIQFLKNRRGSSYPFASLLNIRERGCYPPRGKRCCEGEKFDSRTQRCREIQ